MTAVFWLDLGLAVVLGLGYSVLGGLPLINWLSRVWLRRPLSELGTGNVGVSAAFYHGGTGLGLAAVAVEAAKGILAVAWVQQWFPDLLVGPWLALLCLVAGRFCWGNAAGVTNVVWGVIYYDARVAWLTLLLSAGSFTIFRQRKQGRLIALIIFPVMVALLRRSVAETLAAGVLALTLGWIYEELPDDLALRSTQAQTDSQTMFKFFQGDRAVLNLDQPLSADKVGQKAARLSQLKRWGYAVPMGWVLPAGDDPQPLLESLVCDTQHPLIVRSSAVLEDTAERSMAGQYCSLLNITSQDQLSQALLQVQESAQAPVQPSHGADPVTDAGMAVLVQVQIQGVFSGVAFSRDPLWGGLDCVAVEALPGLASRVVSGHHTPESYRVEFDDLGPRADRVVAQGDVPVAVIVEVARLCREIETRYHGIPQDIEWTYDGQTLWVLQARPITTLVPIWTRKIAAEVIPGVIHPLTWSINRPLTCGVWGEIFSLVLGPQAKGLDFQATAELHFGRAYFNATLLGTIFRRMGLPAESLEFLTRGAKMSRPPLSTTLKALPGLVKLSQREWQLGQAWHRDSRKHLFPLLDDLTRSPISEQLDPLAVQQRIQQILRGLEITTYYNIMAPISAALRQVLGRVNPEALDSQASPETAALKALGQIAHQIATLIPITPLTDVTTLQAELEQRPAGQGILADMEAFFQKFGYISPTATDISVPTWQETPTVVWQLLLNLLHNLPSHPPTPKSKVPQWVQQRVDLKASVATVYGQLLSQLRGCFRGLENQWLEQGKLSASGDIFFLTWPEIQSLLQAPEPMDWPNHQAKIQGRKQDFQNLQTLSPIPFVVYGAEPQLPLPALVSDESHWQGIGASPGQCEGTVQIIHDPSQAQRFPPNTIVVVPYTDAGWLPILTGAVGLIAEVGGRLSHGAIVARELKIPAIMDVPQATTRLKTGQRVRINGQTGQVTLLNPP